jgi:hypothetical protein
MSLEKIQAIEDVFKAAGNNCLVQAIKAIVGCDDTNKLVKSVDEDSMKEDIGIPKIIWIKSKVIILENKNQFETECLKMNLDATYFLNELEQELSDIEKLL